MIYIKAFNNYDEFKEVFGMIQHGNGVKSRRNGILVSFYKSKEVRQLFYSKGWDLCAKNMDGLKRLVYTLLNNHKAQYELKLNHHVFHSDVYSTDALKGITEDGTCGFIRYVKHESDRERVYKMKPGKLLKALIKECPETSILPEQVVNWMCEEFTMEWIAYSGSQSEDYELHVDDNFAGIYSGFRCEGNFGSCMTNGDQYGFYERSVKAHAAYLTNSDGKIVARCVIFDKVFDEDGNTYRYAERQYATGQDDRLKQLLVAKLIAGKHIDCYKRVGADCHNSTAIVNTRGESMSDVELCINCDLYEEDILSYQDTFKYYDISERRAYNHECGCDYRLDTTDRHLAGDEYDEYHDRHCDRVITVYVDGDDVLCDADDLDDFIWMEDIRQYHHRDDVSECEFCDSYYLDCDGYYSDLTGGTYCCESCRDQAEQDYKERYWEYSDYDGEYCEDVKSYREWSESEGKFCRCTISIDSLCELEDDGKMICVDDEYFLFESGVPENAAELIEQYA